jgi:hypothetical protein
MTGNVFAEGVSEELVEADFFSSADGFALLDEAEGAFASPVDLSVVCFFIFHSTFLLLKYYCKFWLVSANQIYYYTSIYCSVC